MTCHLYKHFIDIVKFECDPGRFSHSTSVIIRVCNVFVKINHKFNKFSSRLER